MAVELTDAVNNDGLFDIIEDAIKAIIAVNTARSESGTVHSTVTTFVSTFQGLAKTSLDYQSIPVPLSGDFSSYVSNAGGMASDIRSICQQLLIKMVVADNVYVSPNITDCLGELITQMKAGGYYVVAGTPTITVTDSVDNVGDVVVCSSTRRGDGLQNDNILAEDILVEVVSVTTPARPILQFVGETQQVDLLSAEFPAGSGIIYNLAATDPADSLLSNGDFEDAAVTDVPDGWIIAVGTPSGTVQVTQPGLQTVTISGSPSSGSYILYWTNSDSIKRPTPPINFDASSGDVQTALRTIPGLEAVEVAGTGDSPNYTHTITFLGCSGYPAQLTSTNHLRGGTSPAIAHATTRSGKTGSWRGASLGIRGDNVEKTTLYHVLPTLATDTVYFLHARVGRRNSEQDSESSSTSSSGSSNSSSTSSSSSKSTSSSQGSSHSSASSASSASVSSNSSSSKSSNSSSSRSSGSSQSLATSSSSSSSISTSSNSSSSLPSYELSFEIVDGVAGALVHDSAGVANRLYIDADHLPLSSHGPYSFSFRLPASVKQPAYLRIRLKSGLPLGDTIYIDDVAIAAGLELYSGGPWVAAFSGRKISDIGDAYTMAVSNTKGTYQDYFNRMFAMADKGLLLPTSGRNLLAYS